MTAQRVFAIDNGRQTDRVPEQGPLFIEVAYPRKTASKGRAEACTWVEGAPPVLLVHGASASSNTFKDPDGGLIDYLQARPDDPPERRRFNVFTVDWRSSKLTADRLIPDDTQPNRQTFTLDAAVDDLTAAVATVQRISGIQDAADIPIVGHCIGGALVAQAVAMGRCSAKNIVLTTLALFFKVGIEGWIKGNDFVLEDLLTDINNTKHIVSAEAATQERRKWPAALEERYQFWLDSGLHHGCGSVFCERISFMYGMPFRLDDMLYLHDMAGGLESQFGAMPLGIYAHCLRNLRRGWSAPYEGTDASYVTEAQRRHFANRKITLISGNENQVWHRNSIDVMHEWLTNGDKLPGLRASKRVLARYGHQDLYWSRKAPSDVYPFIAEGLQP